MKNYFLLVLFNLSVLVNLSQGVRFDKERYTDEEPLEMDQLGFTDNLPEKYSLRKFCPPVLTQKGLTCVGWASAYGAMSTIFNSKFDITKENEKFLYSFDPNFIYSLISENNKNDCMEGTSIVDAMEVLKNNGCKKMLLPEKTKCNSAISSVSKGYAIPFIIKMSNTPPENWYENTNSEKINMLKKSLYDDLPIILGMNTTKSLRNIASNGLWAPSKDDSLASGHAVCIIGYDDNKYGGSFEIMNSWGKNYGDNGYNWVRYSDILNYIVELHFISVYDFKKSVHSNYTCYYGDCLNGYGHKKNNDGSRIEGNFKDGQINGYGLKHYKNGASYTGTWKNGKEDGSGYYFNPYENKWFKAEFSNGELINKDALGFIEETKKTNQNKLDDVMNYFNELDLLKVGESTDIEILDND
ncbi:MAG: hypothetical protein CL846_06690 [Crocinitomicaceae bacterium]|nr:hypothetical protein [Crocinitomicaceae bacterium]|tara:strand:- start:4809 stop:6044 length:1236 start_codon:yes stop_codon:yes gene_type:complete